MLSPNCHPHPYPHPHPHPHPRSVFSRNVFSSFCKIPALILILQWIGKQRFLC